MSVNIHIHSSSGADDGASPILSVQEPATGGMHVIAVLPDGSGNSLGFLPWLPPPGQLFYIDDGSGPPTSYSVLGYETVWDNGDYTTRLRLQHAE